MTTVSFMLYCRCWPDYYWEWATAHWKVCSIGLSIFYMVMYKNGNWYPGHITDNGVPLFLTNSPKNYTHSCSQDLLYMYIQWLCVVQNMICSKIFTFESQLHKLYCLHGIIWDHFNCVSLLQGGAQPRGGWTDDQTERNREVWLK